MCGAAAAVRLPRPSLLPPCILLCLVDFVRPLGPLNCLATSVWCYKVYTFNVFYAN